MSVREHEAPVRGRRYEATVRRHENSGVWSANYHVVAVDPGTGVATVCTVQSSGRTLRRGKLRNLIEAAVVAAIGEVS
jgi:hypothetical protein